VASNIHNSDEINKIVIDPNVIASKDSAELFANFFNIKKVVGFFNLYTFQITNMH